MAALYCFPFFYFLFSNFSLILRARKLADMTKRTVFSVLEGTYDKEKFVATLKRKGIDT